jgi:hypothetical protein
VLVGEHPQRDEVRPLGGDRSAPGKLDPPDVLVPDSGTESREHHAEADDQGLNPLAPSSRESTVIGRTW